ncbi:TM2 domain-containing protein 3 isoform X2 [Callorhinchus milii]|uniref:TM2 domain-containing protein 3 isoform X2 n=1 Tax=Callorhinchus milii TaxID=7868 RepID=UPI0004575F5B|nr:TM2 domain-containing protein 3 isoform X2 [Callorhinchus milii]|eukprot:gi/632938972/ref/XP_007907118.1/ PREDICTED: TM2 domain-containing protein 3 isoform X2 [Callorhinchus milii]
MAAVSRSFELFLFVSQLHALLGGDSFSTKDPNRGLSAESSLLPTTILNTTPSTLPAVSTVSSHLPDCPSAGLCSKLPASCMTCEMHNKCVYGKDATFNCTTKPGVQCVDENKVDQKFFQITMICRFCWQLPPTEYNCTNLKICKTVQCPREYYISNCTVLPHVHCLGYREFQKKMYCNLTGGYKWSTALALSITLGGFGADRFYLGQWKEGLGKLFSFGGLGIWTLIDVLLIGIGYVGPADGSLYI